MAQCVAVCSVGKLRGQNIIAKDQRFSALNKKSHKMSHRKLQTAWIFKSIFIFLQPFPFIPKRPVANLWELHRNHSAILNCAVVETLFFIVCFLEADMKSKNFFCVKFSRNWCFQRRLIQSSCCCILLLIYYSQSAGKPSCGDALHIPRQTRSVYMGLHTDLPKQYMLRKGFKKQMPGTNPKQNKLGLNLLSVSLKLDFLHGHWWENKASYWCKMQHLSRADTRLQLPLFPNSQLLSVYVRTKVCL